MLKKNRRKSSINRVPPPANQQQKSPGLLSSLGQSMVWGAGMGLGSEAGHSIFRGVFGNNNQQNQPMNQTVNQSFNKCEEIHKLYEKCLTANSFENDKCLFLKEDLQKFCNI